MDKRGRRPEEGIMFRSRLTKPEEIKRDVNGEASKKFSVQTILLEQPACDWPHFHKEWSSWYKFKIIPVLQLHIDVAYLNTAGKSIGGGYCLELDKEKSILPHGANTRWFTPQGNACPTALLLPGYWTGEKWSWEQYSALWLVTAGGDDVPIVQAGKKRVWPFRTDPCSQFKILSPTYCNLKCQPGFGERLELRRKETEDGKSTVALVYSDGRKRADELITTEKNPLATLVYMLNDTSGWREKVFAQTVAELREEIRMLGKEKDSAEKERDDCVRELEGRLYNLSSANRYFFSRAIERFNATKSVSRNRVFADFRKLLENANLILGEYPVSPLREDDRIAKIFE